MLYEITNPLDVIDNLAYKALNAAYFFIINEKCYNPKHIPSIEMIHNHFVDHFIQEMVVDVMTKQSYDTMGADNFIDFMQKVEQKRYHPFIPDIIQLRNMLEICNINYMIGDVVHNQVIKGVW